MAQVVPFYVAFLLVMALMGWCVARLIRLDPPGGRAIVFTAATCNFSNSVFPVLLRAACWVTLRASEDFLPICEVKFGGPSRFRRARRHADACR